MKKLRVLTPAVAKEKLVGSNPLEQACADFEAQSALIGDVLETGLFDLSGRVLVRWRTLDGVLNEHWLPVVRGLSLNQGDLVLLLRPGNWHEWLVIQALAAGAQPLSPTPLSVQPTVDKRRLEIEAQDEIVLRCGKASITLRGNGRVVIRGAYVESRSEGTNRIKGGNVQIN